PGVDQQPTEHRQVDAGQRRASEYCVDPRIARFGLGQALSPNTRIHAIGTDQDLRFGGGSIAEVRDHPTRALLVARERSAEVNMPMGSRKECLAQRLPIDLARNVTTPLPGVEIEGKAVQFPSPLVEEQERPNLADNAGCRSNEIVISRWQTGAKSFAPRLVNGESISLPAGVRPWISLKHVNRPACGGQRVRETQAAETSSDDDGLWLWHAFQRIGRDSLLLVIIREAIHHSE